MLNFIDAGTLRKMFLAGAKNLESKKEWINELNVFPVPDGDTGTNMTLTVMSAAKELANLKENASIEEIGKTIATGTLRGARGNSGVIMSQLCRGFSKELEGTVKLDNDKIAKGFERAAQTAYKAVMKPKEGTILTVAKAAASKAAELAGKGLSMDEFFRQVIDYAEKVLEKTPDMLPVLKEAGVVDSGGQGLVEFLKGAYEAYMGKDTEFEFELSAEQKTEKTGAGIDTSSIETADIKFGYCTEFIIMLEQSFGDAEENAFKAFLESIGDSIVCVHMDDIVKVHVHTNDPGLAIQKALSYGALTSMKIDNMREEHNEKVIKEADREAASKAEDDKKLSAAFEGIPKKEYGFVTVCSGEGFAQLFKNISVDEIIEGGQTMNPSTDDILKAVDRVNAENIFVLPNNGNIIMAAQQAKQICKDKNIVVIPTKTVTQGIAAVINYVPAMTIEENEEHMKEAIALVGTAEITHAIRDTMIDGREIKVGDYMSIGDDGLLAVGKDIKQVAADSVRAMADEDTAVVTIYYGKEASEEEAKEIAEILEAEFEDADFDIVCGMQPVYYYIISVE